MAFKFFQETSGDQRGRRSGNIKPRSQSSAAAASAAAATAAVAATAANGSNGVANNGQSAAEAAAHAVDILSADTANFEVTDCPQHRYKLCAPVSYGVAST